MREFLLKKFSGNFLALFAELLDLCISRIHLVSLLSVHFDHLLRLDHLVSEREFVFAVSGLRFLLICPCPRILVQLLVDA